MGRDRARRLETSKLKINIMKKTICLSLYNENEEYLKSLKVKSIGAAVRLVLNWFFDNNRKADTIQVSENSTIQMCIRLDMELINKLASIKIESNSYTINCILAAAQKAGFTTSKMIG
jgi:hypothetical protein